MGLIPEDKIAEIRDRTDIVAVVGQYVPLKRAGANHKGLCPFHIEKSPSFNVNSQKQIFRCFGCGKSGDVFTFLQEIEGQNFNEVVRDLAGRAGIELPEAATRQQREAARAEETERSRMVRLHELAANYYRETLLGTNGTVARDYLQSRGIGTEVAAAFSVGYAPPGWEGLTRLFEAKRVPHELAERSGLLRPRPGATLAAGAPPTRASHYDSFVDRVVYGLTSPMGELIGFGGRLLVDSAEQPKYKNSPETLIYRKGDNLFGLSQARHAIRRSTRALLVEGNFDVMTLHQAGINYAVAPQGTAVTPAQVQLLRRFASEVVLMLDSDAAGRAATMKIIVLFASAGLPVRIAHLNAKGGRKVDPDELARTDLPRLQQLIDGATDAVEFYLSEMAATALPSVPGKVAAIERCVPLLRAISDPLARDLYADRLAQLLKVDIALIRKGIRATDRELGRPTQRADAKAASEVIVQPVVARALPAVESKLLGLLGHAPQLWESIDDATLAALGDDALRELLQAAKRDGDLVPQKLLVQSAPEIRDAVAAALLAEEFAQLGEADPRQLMSEILDRIKLPNDRGQLEAERQKALLANDHRRVRELTAKILQTRLRPEAGPSDASRGGRGHRTGETAG